MVKVKIFHFDLVEIQNGKTLLQNLNTRKICDNLSKIRESLYKKAFIIGGKSEIGGRGGVKNDPKKLNIIYGRPLTIIPPNSRILGLRK